MPEPVKKGFATDRLFWVVLRTYPRMRSVLAVSRAFKGRIGIFTHKRAFRAGKRQIKAVHFFGHEKRAGYQYETTALYESI